MLVGRAQRCVAAVVAQEDDQRVPGDPLGLDVIHHLVEARVHAFHQCRVGLSGLTLARFGVIGRVAWVAVERRVQRVKREVEEEGFAIFDRLIDLLFGFDGECLGEECLGAVVLLQVRHRASLVALDMSVAVLPVIAARLSPRATGDVDIEAKIVGELRGLIVRSEMRLANEDRAIACGLEPARQGALGVLKPGPVPIGRAEGAFVVAL